MRKHISKTELLKGKEDGIVHLDKKGNEGNTIVSDFPKTDDGRYGAPLNDMISRGWVGFINTKAKN